MSRENVDVVRRAWASLFAGGSLELFHPEVRVQNFESHPITKPYFGHQGLRDWFQDVFQDSDDLRIVGEEMIDLGDGRVLTVTRFNALGRASGVPLEVRWAAVNWVRDGKVVRGQGYATKEQALEALGLRE